MQTYSEKSTQLAVDASVAVQVLMGSTPGDCELLPLKPRMADETMIAELAARWPGRGLRTVGVIGLIGTAPRCAFKEALDAEQVSALAAAFLTYLHALFADSFAVQSEVAEIAELERMYSLPDTRPN